MSNYNESLISRLIEGGFIIEDEGQSWHGYPTQFEARDAKDRPVIFRMRSQRATLRRGAPGEGFFSMLDTPEVYINVYVPEGTSDETAFFALTKYADECEKAMNGERVNIDLASAQRPNPRAMVVDLMPLIREREASTLSIA